MVGAGRFERPTPCAQGSAALRRISIFCQARGGISFRSHTFRPPGQFREISPPRMQSHMWGREVTARHAVATIGRQPEGINPLLFVCAKTVSEGHLFQPRSLLIERKQIPQIVVIAGTLRKPMAPLEITRLPWAHGDYPDLLIAGFIHPNFIIHHNDGPDIVWPHCRGRLLLGRIAVTVRDQRHT